MISVSVLPTPTDEAVRVDREYSQDWHTPNLGV
jgi:hypothetical protein